MAQNIIKKFAVLIDADNSSYKHIEPILEEVAKYGIASVKRIYGDWSVEALQSWRDKLLSHAITPVQQFAYVKQKDATDMRLVIDAMDLLFAGDLDGFCIVSSDSDFTPLASRIRESGLLVYGFGEKKTVNSFVNACDKFIYIENLLPTDDKLVSSVTNNTPNSSSKEVSQAIEVDKPTYNLIYRAIKENADSDGWVRLSQVGAYINNVKPDFDPRSYNCSNLSELMSRLEAFDTKRIGSVVYAKKFSFANLIDQVVNWISSTPEKKHNWMNVEVVVEHLYRNRKQNGLEGYSKIQIHNKVNAIYSNWLEFNNSRTKVRLPLDK